MQVLEEKTLPELTGAVLRSRGLNKDEKTETVHRLHNGCTVEYIIDKAEHDKSLQRELARLFSSFPS